MDQAITFVSEHYTYGEASGEVLRLSGYFMLPNIKYSIRENFSGKYEVIKFFFGKINDSP